MYRLLAQMYGYTPREIADMTYDQQLMLLHKSSTATFRNMQEYMKWISSKGGV